jgi:ketosteroid isomerase-like protein
MRLFFRSIFLSAVVWASDPRAELLEADRAFDRDTAARGLDGWMSWFAEDAQINARTGVIKGKAALREHYSKSIGQPGFSLRWQPLYAEASKDGTLGYTFGKGESVTTKPDGTTEKRPANYLTVWRKQKDGSWKVATDIGN